MRWLFVLFVGFLVILGMFQVLEVDTFAPSNFTIFAIGLFFVLRAWRVYREEGFTRRFEFILYLAVIGIVFGLAIVFNLGTNPIWVAAIGLLILGFAIRLWRM